MSQQHTPEPWATEYRKQFDGNYSQQIFDTEGKLIATVAWYPVEIGPGHTVTNREANARRIVACVNACAGISTDDLERYYNTGGGIDDALQEASLRDHVLAVQQRDVLLAALEEYAKFDDDLNGEAKAAIAIVKGGAA